MTLVYDHLIGLQFKYAHRDCYSLIRDFYRTNFGLELPNYARPNFFWREDMRLYDDLFYRNGFRSLDCHPSEWRPGDAVLMAIKSRHACHAGVFVENGQLLHHLYGRLSVVEPYRGLLRNSTVAVLRHKDVDYKSEVIRVDIMEVLPDASRAKISAHLSRRQQDGEGGTGAS